MFRFWASPPSPRVALAGWLGLMITAVGSTPSYVPAAEVTGTVKSIEPRRGVVVVTDQSSHEDITVRVAGGTPIERDGKRLSLGSIEKGMKVTVDDAMTASRLTVDNSEAVHKSIPEEFLYNVRHNLFKPLLLFFYMGFLVPILRVKFEFPYVFYQALTIFLLIAIGWHGGEELARLDAQSFAHAAGFMGVGFITNTVIAFLAYGLLNLMAPKMRRVDRATVAGYYGSDSAGTFVTCLGVLATIHMSFDAYMPVMLAVMEAPGCLVALFLISRMRHHGMDPAGTMPDEPGYDPNAKPALSSGLGPNGHGGHGHSDLDETDVEDLGPEDLPDPEVIEAIEEERELSLEKRSHPTKFGRAPLGNLSPQMLHEVFLNPGMYLLFGGIIVGFISGLQGPEVTRADDSFFVTLFQGVLCLFLLEMGMTASRKLRDLHSAGLGFILFGLLAPNLFATIGIVVAHAFSMFMGTVFEPGSYVLFAVLCGAASYIAVPAVQRLAIPEASPTLPLAASLGLTFSYNVTIGIPVYIQIAKLVTDTFPIH